jgi:hypothetical protein
LAKQQKPKVSSILKIKISGQASLHPNLLKILEEFNCQIEHSFESHLLSQTLEVSSDTAFFLIKKENIPHKFEDFIEFKKDLSRFLDYYQTRIILFQNYTKLIDKISPKISKALSGLLMSIFFTYNSAIVPTRNAKETAMCIKSLAKRIQIVDHPPIIARIKSKSETLFDAQQFFIEGLMQCGPTKACELCNQFESPIEIIQRIKEENLMYTRTGNLKPTTEGVFSGIEGFGPQFIGQNQEMLFSKQVD